MPHEFINDAGEKGVLSGKVRAASIAKIEEVSDCWVSRKHPDYSLWQSDEERQRASYLATRRHLAQFLVPHRHEESPETTGADLRRSNYGYGIGLNKAYLSDIMGHIMSADLERDWGPLGTADDEAQPAEPTEGTIANILWNDATANGTPWDEFFGTVLEWMLSSPGGLVLVDTPPGDFGTMEEALRNGQRPFFRFVPMSWVWDLSVGTHGFRWIKLIEEFDDRVPDPASQGRSVGDTGISATAVLYELLEDGTTLFTRWNFDCEKLDEFNLGRFENPQGRPILPIIPVSLGGHPDIEWLGAGLLMGLEDIVIDLYNLITEVREAYRNSAFPIWTYRGADFEGVRSAIDAGTVLVNLGTQEDAEIVLVNADTGEVTAGLSLVELSLSAWALAARRKAADAMAESAQARSGVALQAEFQLDLKPLMVKITRELNSIETQAMFLAAQMMGESLEAAFEVGITRNDQFRLEEEASRISRIIQEFLLSIPLPPTAKKEIVMRWLENSDIVDLDEEVEGEGKTLREVIEEEAMEMFNSDMMEAQARSAAFQQDIAIASGDTGEEEAEDGLEDEETVDEE